MLIRCSINASRINFASPKSSSTHWEQRLAAPHTWSDPARGLERRQGIGLFFPPFPSISPGEKSARFEENLHFELCEPG